MSVHTYMNARVRIDMSAVNLAPPHFIPPVMRSFVRDGESDYEKKRKLIKKKTSYRECFRVWFETTKTVPEVTTERSSSCLGRKMPSPVRDDPGFPAQTYQPTPFLSRRSNPQHKN